MFCPKCATQNVDGASFCRSCGANISLVPQALTGKLPEAPVEACNDFGLRKSRRSEPSLEHAVRSLMMGIAFAIISVLIGKYSPGGWTWWYWMLIPAATFLGKGISDLLRMKQANGQAPTISQPQINSVRPTELPVPRTGELMPPVSSVTEGTTRHLGAEAQTRHFDSH
jgi:zinc-ribbon domain